MRSCGATRGANNRAAYVGSHATSCYYGPQ
jgi:hypothetical protein